MDAPFPTDPAEFDADERISFSKLDSKFLAVLDDGTEFEFDADAKRWVPAEDDDAGADIDANADTEDYGGARPLDWPAAGDESKKRKNGPEDEAAAQVSRRASPSEREEEREA